MKDIRIITGKNVSPSKETVTALLTRQNADLKTAGISDIYERLLPKLNMRLLPKAAYCICSKKSILSSGRSKDDGLLLCAMLTVGSSVSRLIDRYAADNDLLTASVLNAMADSSLFAFEEQLHTAILQICRENGCGISCRLELPADLPLETQTAVYNAVDAGRTLGLSITNGRMLKPEKSMSLIFVLTKDMTQKNLAHDCRLCPDHNCPLRKNSGIMLTAELEKDASKTTIPCRKGSNLLETLRQHSISPSAECGGAGVCGKCGVRITNGFLPVTPEDAAFFSKKELEDGMRLACKAVLQEDLSVSVAKTEPSGFFALGNCDTDNPKRAASFPCQTDDCGIAIDIGTTTLAFSLLDYKSGSVIASHTAVNPQRTFGADVISRIQAANSGKSGLLEKCIKTGIFKGVRSLCSQHPKKRIRHIAIAANTVMLHLLRGYSCEGFCHYPFSPKSLSFEELPFEKVFAEPFPAALQPDVTLLPGISAFIGADITAGLYACGIPEENETALFLDLGTNGEMALKTKNGIFAASAAAGPAFEGGNIKWGTGSVEGAISHVEIHGEVLELQTIGQKPPAGICGTGVIETAAGLFLSGIIGASGNLAAPWIENGYPLAQTENGAWITFTQKDIREIQMAKAAIRAGIELLFLHSGITSENVSRVFLAGGFGYFLNPKKGAAIGILPLELALKTTAAGNSSLAGALLYLARRNKSPLQFLAEHTEEILLAKEEIFQDLYIKYMSFGE